jgi:hypothetical protein
MRVQFKVTPDLVDFPPPLEEPEYLTAITKGIFDSAKYEMPGRACGMSAPQNFP